MIAEDLAILKRTRGAGWDTVFQFRKTWGMAIDEFNRDHPNDKPMKLECRSCLFKVQAYLSDKYDKA